MHYFIWLALAVFLIFIEAMTVNLVCVWFALGAVAGMLVSIVGFGLLGQLWIFVLVSALSLTVTRPLVRKFTRRRITPTNADRVLGGVGRVTEAVDRENGAVYIDGKTWSARSDSGTVIPVGARVFIERIEGVKLYVAEVWDRQRA